MGKPNLALVTPAIVNGPVVNETETVPQGTNVFSWATKPVPRMEPYVNRPPKRRRNRELRSREYLTQTEVERLITAAGQNHYAHRDATMILVAYRHGLRAAEVVSLQWHAIDFGRAEIHVARVKGSASSTHPLTGRELRMLRRLQREQKPKSSFVFTSERDTPFAAAGYRKMVARLGKAAGFDFPVHPHQLRHACGYALANRGTDTRTLQAYLGHKNIQHTVRYTELAPARFRDLWTD
jgi:type 1 fimbriae regulatory protein FimB/type 1 fimbriae regulatory protein FimE